MVKVEAEVLADLQAIVDRQALPGRHDAEADHLEADELLLCLVTDEVGMVYRKITRWYS